MKYMEIIPLVGIKFNNQMIELYSSREAVESVFGKSYTLKESSLYYFNNDLRFDFDKNEKVEFIEFLAGYDGKIQPKIYGVDAFQVQSDDLFNILKKKNNGNIGDNENGYSYEFLNISVGVFRESIPGAIQEMIGDAENEGEPMNAADIEYEKRMANHWATIGIGIKGYYASDY